uniref:Uncharacterized protein n=1 Tax=Anguilla anguilla TaxID=7936 RepID=A0A0E9VTT4_ANGAN
MCFTSKLISKSKFGSVL